MTGDADRIERAADLIERLLEDHDFRAAFRQRPAAGARAYGLGDVADELDRTERPMLTLDGRESRSSLAGALLAAAAESVEVVDLVRGGRQDLGGEGLQAFERAATRGNLRVLAAPTDRDADTPAPAPTTGGGGAVALRHAADDDSAQPSGGDAPVEVAEYPGDNASKARIAAWMARQARDAGLPPELPVMASLQESSLRNLDHGDRDSVGYFQMRLRFWNQGPWKGYPDKPELQMKWFIQRALEERKKHPGVYNGSSDYGRWIADIEQCQEDLRGLYQGHLRTARGLIEQGGGSRGGPATERDGADRDDVQPSAPMPAPVPLVPGAYGVQPPSPGVYGAQPPTGGAGLYPAVPSANTAGPVALVPPAAPAAPAAPVPLAAAPAPPAAPEAPPVIRDSAIVPDEPSPDDNDGGGSAGARMVARARRELGVAETSENDSPRISVYRQATAGAPGPGPWCAYFVSWLAKESGAPIGADGQGFGRVDDVWAWAQSAGRAVPTGSGTPQPGDLIVWDEHIGMVERVLPDGRIQTIEGNTSDHVGRRIHPAGSAIGFVRMP